MGLVPLQAALKGPTSTISPQPWDWILGAATPWGHGQAMEALEQYLRSPAVQVAARQPTASLEAPGAGQAGSEPPSGYGCMPVPEMPSMSPGLSSVLLGCSWPTAALARLWSSVATPVAAVWGAGTVSQLTPAHRGAGAAAPAQPCLQPRCPGTALQGAGPTAWL